MVAKITCTCGYSGPGRAAGQDVVCPLCGEPTATAPEEKTWQVPCPKGHVPMVCSKCNEPVAPQISASLEQKEGLRRRQEQEEAKFAKKWLQRAIAAAVLFGLLIVTLIVMSVIKG